MHSKQAKDNCIEFIIIMVNEFKMVIHRVISDLEAKEHCPNLSFQKHPLRQADITVWVIIMTHFVCCVYSEYVDTHYVI